MLNLQHCYCALLLWSIFLFAQEKKISGKVINAIDGAPITGATITIKSSGAGTVTDAEGAFSITVPNEKSMLIISSVGFDPIEISTAGQTFLTIVLKERQGSLEEVVVTGYTTQKKKDLTGAVSVVNVNQMKAQPVASPVEALQGKATGVHIINDGAPGSTPQIRIRGFSTINNNDPLFIIDGVPFEGKLSWLNQNDIESLQVLKDASAASIYGARANNGVVIITTKKGKNGASPTVSFDTYVGTQVPRRESFPKLMNPQQFAQNLYASYANLNDPSQAPGQGSTTGTNYGTGPSPVLPEYLLAGTKTGLNVTAADADPAKYNYSRDPATFYQIVKANQQGTNWFNEITTNAPMQNYMLSVRGGGQSSNYAISGSYLNQKGTVKYTGFERYTFRANTNFSLLKNKLRIGENFQYARTKDNGVGVNPNSAGSYQSEGSPLNYAYTMQTIIPVYDIMGNFAGTKGDKLGEAAQNPMSLLYRAKDDYTLTNVFLGNVYAEVDVVKGLIARTSFGLRYENWNTFDISYPNPESAEGSITRNSLSETFGFNNDWTWTNTLNYKHSFGKHTIGALAGTETIKTQYRYLSGSRNDFFVLGDLDYYYLDAGSSNVNNGGNGASGSLYSLFGRIDYGFDSKYLLSATLRRDGSSNFGPENKYGLFPAVSAAWRISEEKFMQSMPWINDLKLRIGYGVTGNQRIPPYNYLQRFSSAQNASYYPIAGGSSLSSGIWLSDYENLAIKWEELRSVNVGLDFSLFNNAIDGSIEWYNRDTRDMLYPVPQPSAGVGQGKSPFVNVGTMNNKGVEIGVNYHYNKPNANNFTFDFGVNFSRNINKVTFLAQSVSEQPYLVYRNLTIAILKEGQPFGSFYGYKMTGIYQNAAEAAAGYAGARVGGPKYADVSGPDGKPDGVISPFDRTIIGSPHPAFIYSFNVNAGFRNFDIVMFFNGSQGNDLYQISRQFTDFGLFGGAVSTRLLDAWSPNNTNSNIPSPYAKRSSYELNSSSYYVLDGSFFRMKNLQLGYTFSEKILGKYIKSLRAYVSATNLFTITKYPGIDPEVSQFSSTFSAPGVDSGIYPVSRQYLLGASVTF